MIVYRITKSSYARKLDGKGAAKSEINRWNSKGTELVYTSESEALARAELGGHINLSMVPGLVVVEIEISDNHIYTPTEFPANWDKTPPDTLSKRVGDNFVEQGAFLALKVPSRYDRKQTNLLLNPNFSQYERLVKVVSIRPLT